MEYNGYLLSGNTPVAQIQHGRIIPLDSSRMPLYLAAGGSFENWLVSRAIDRHRPNSRILKKVLRLTAVTPPPFCVYTLLQSRTTIGYGWMERTRFPMRMYDLKRTSLLKSRSPAASPAIPERITKTSFPPDLLN